MQNPQAQPPQMHPVHAAPAPQGAPQQQMMSAAPVAAAPGSIPMQHTQYAPQQQQGHVQGTTYQAAPQQQQQQYVSAPGLQVGTIPQQQVGQPVAAPVAQPPQQYPHTGLNGGWQSDQDYNERRKMIAKM